MQLQPHTLRNEATRRGTDVTDTSPSLLRFGGKASALFEPSRKLCCRGPSRVNAQRHSRLRSPGLYRQLWLGVCQGEQLDPAKPAKSSFSPRRRQPCRWCEAPCCPRSCTGGLALGCLGSRAGSQGVQSPVVACERPLDYEHTWLLEAAQTGNRCAQGHFGEVLETHVGLPGTCC